MSDPNLLGYAWLSNHKKSVCGVVLLKRDYDTNIAYIGISDKETIDADLEYIKKHGNEIDIDIAKTIIKEYGVVLKSLDEE